ncbi:MAG: ABC transporter ATP-binding protein [Roseovarius sp.]|nr:ABC transporter ATP-binding protein [Roseovarius sp.]MCY4291394.1 ABC transporter ATP-binding protein [Roseovarius sp.]
MSLLEIENLSLSVRNVRILRKVSLKVGEAEIAGVVGESGAGKSMLGKAVLGVLPGDVSALSGEIRLHGENLLKLASRQRRMILKRSLSLIPQDPMTALNPCRTIGSQVGEVLSLTGRRSLRADVTRWLDAVRIPFAARVAKSYPHELSGGMRQRALIAAAFASRPKLVIADEPTTALDVTVQKDVLVLIRDLQRETGVGLLFITHDLCVVAKICGSVTVMHGGRVIEQAPCENIIRQPGHAYTAALLKTTPRHDRFGGGLEPVPESLVESMIAEAESFDD